MDDENKAGKTHGQSAKAAGPQGAASPKPSQAVQRESLLQNHFQSKMHLSRAKCIQAGLGKGQQDKAGWAVMLTVQDASFQEAGAWPSSPLISDECWQQSASGGSIFIIAPLQHSSFFYSIIFLPSSCSQNEQKYVYSRGGEASGRAEIQLSQQHASLTKRATFRPPAWLSEGFQKSAPHTERAAEAQHMSCRSTKCQRVPAALILQPRPWDPAVVSLFPTLRPFFRANPQHLHTGRGMQHTRPVSKLSELLLGCNTP